MNKKAAIIARYKARNGARGCPVEIARELGVTQQYVYEVICVWKKRGDGWLEPAQGNTVPFGFCVSAEDAALMDRLEAHTKKSRSSILRAAFRAYAAQHMAEIERGE